MIDVNVSLHRWPFRRLKGDEPGELVAKLRSQGVTEAWTGSFDALLHRDLGEVNRRLTEDCKRHGEGLLVPFGSIHPLLPDWEEELRRCHEIHRMPGIRLHPNYHGYRLDHANVLTLLRSATARRLIVQVAVRMEDERTQHPLVRVPPVDLTVLPRLLNDIKDLRLVILNGPAGLNPEHLRGLTSTGQVSFDMAMVEGVGGVGRLLQSIAVERILFGSHYPFFYHEAATLKLKEADLNESQRKAMTLENGKRLRAR